MVEMCFGSVFSNIIPKLCNVSQNVYFLIIELKTLGVNEVWESGSPIMHLLSVSVYNQIFQEI